MRSLFNLNKKRVRSGAILWTLLIFILCFLPGKDIPDVQIPLIDKWAHFILFGVYAFLWLLSIQNFQSKHLIIVFFSAVLTGYFVECVQGLLTFLGRDYELLDVIADSVGGILGVSIFYFLRKFYLKNISRN